MLKINMGGGGWRGREGNLGAGVVVRGSMRSGLTVVVVVLVAATAFGLWRRLTDGRIRGVSGAATNGAATNGAATSTTTNGAAADGTSTVEPGLSAADLGAPLGERATLVQFSTAFCQPCRATRRILDEVANQLVGVSHVEIDAEDHLDLVRRLDVRRTPTVFVLDGSGAIIRRAVGQPRKADVISALGEAIPG